MSTRDRLVARHGLAVGVLAALCCALGLLAAGNAAAETVTFTTPGCSAWTAPIGSDFRIQATGAEGAAAGSYIFPVAPEEVLNSGGPGGRGDVVSATLPVVTTGTSLFVCVDVGGGTGGASEGERRCEELRGFGGCFTGGIGGGASGVSLGSDFTQPVLVAGGGGGGGGLSPYGTGKPAYGGGAAGAAGGGGPRELAEPLAAFDGYFGGGGGTGSTSAPGAAGTAGTDGIAGTKGAPFGAGGPGAGGNGGFGEFNGPCNSSPCEGGGGGGGGGGYYGGGGGGGGGIDGAGGGGGSSLVPAGGNLALAAEAAVPQVQISYAPGPAAVTEPALGVVQTTATLNATVDPDGRIVTECEFEYGKTELYGSVAPCTPSPGAGESAVAVSASLTELAPKTPYHFRIVARNEGGTSIGSDETFETLPNPPAVTGVSPGAGLESAGTSVTITGAGFAEATSVKFGALGATHYTINSATSITAVAPAQTAGTVNVTVGNTGGTSAINGGDQFTYVAPGHAPTITAVSPKKGPAAGGSTVTISGTGFVGVTAVKFGSVAANGFKVTSPTSITAEAPPETTGTVELTVNTPNGESGVAAKDSFTFEAPTVTAITPNTGPKAGGTPVVIKGSGFALGTATSFKFGKAAATSVDCTSSTVCSAVTPAAAKTGTVSVVVDVGTSKSKKDPPGDEFTYN